jgi:hypothetical protein
MTTDTQTLGTTLTGIIATMGLMISGAAAPSPAHAQQPSMASINAQMSAFNHRLAQNQQRINGWVSQKAADPTVRAGYAQYVARARAAGVQPQSLDNYAYGYIATQGYSSRGTAIFRANEVNNNQKIASATADLRAAEGARGQAQMGMQQGFSNNQQEFGNLLRGTSTYYGPNGSPQVLPHTWESNTLQHYQGNQYYVDYSGQYHQLNANGSWYALTPR